MTFSLDDAPFPEPSALVGFSQNRLIRDAENRNELSLPAALADPNVRFVLYAGASVIVERTEAGRLLFEQQEIAPFKPKLERAILLGASDRGPVVAASIGIDAETLEEPLKCYDFRSLLYSNSIAAEDASIVAQGGSLLHWHRTNRFCGKCGTASVSRIGGYKRECPSCEHMIFPRTDPVVIMLAVRGDRCLMGRSPHFPEGWFSTLACFVEPGETFEDAVRRETVEESGIRVGKVRYYASQPWPFPHSLMIGAHCEALNDDIRMDESELEDCRWFSRAEVHQMIEGTHPHGFTCPPNLAIASFIIRDWAGYPLNT